MYLPDGLSVPIQTSSDVYQDFKMPGRAKVTFRAISDSRVSGPKVESRGGSLWVGNTEIPAVLSYKIIPAETETGNEEIEAVLMCEVFEVYEEIPLWSNKTQNNAKAT